MTRHRPWLLAGVGLVALAAAVGTAAAWTAPTRGAVRAYTKLLGAANREDVEAARELCSSRYAGSHPLRPAPDGGLVGLPRNIHKNFQVWREGANVWLCPTNRQGPVYQFVHERGRWRFDGPVGLLRADGKVDRLEDGAVPESLGRGDEDPR